MSDVLQTDVGAQDGKRYVTDLIFELQTIPHFFESAMAGVMPGNQKTTLPLFPFELIHLWGQPYSEWALAPLNELSGTPNDRVMTLMGSNEDPSRLVVTEMLLNHIKSKIWEGMPLISDAWWLTKNLDDQANVQEAMAYINLVISVFSYLQLPQIQANMRDTYNLVYDELLLFQNAINGLQQELGETPLQIAALFEEFTRATFNFIERQARDWIFNRLKSLRAIWKGRIMGAFLSGRMLNSTQATVRVDHLALAIFQKLIELGLTADQKVRVPIDGFKGLATRQTRPSNTDTQSYTPQELMAMYIEIEKLRKDEVDTNYTSHLNARTSARHIGQAESPMPEFLEPTMLLFDREFTHIEIQPTIDVYPTRVPETWVQNLMNRSDLSQFGFVAYRISHAVNDQDWTSFLTKLEAGMNAWSGVAGSDTIKHKAKLQWLDGKDLNIPDGDIGAVREHFRSFADSNLILPGMQTNICLAVDTSCIDAFNAASGSRDLRTGENADYRGYVLAIDSDYDIHNPSDGDSPGYEGVVKIVDQLIWTDLYAFQQTQSQFLDEIGRLAIDHPSQMYVGPTVPFQTTRWQRKKAELGKE